MEAQKFISLRDSLLFPCDNGDLDKFKLAHNNLINIKSINNHEYELILTFAFSRVTESGHLDILKYLIDEHSNEFHQSILDVDMFFCGTCMYEKPELAKYILERNQLNDSGLNITDAFKYANKYGLIDVIQVLIFDYNIQQNEEINGFLEEEPRLHEEITNMFKVQKLKNNLSGELSSIAAVQNKKLKV